MPRWGLGCLFIAGLWLAGRAPAQDAGDDAALVQEVVQAACDRPVALLGELPSHGEARAFAAKARIVRRLVDDCGFDTLLFEAPRYDFDALREPARRPTVPATALDAAIGPFWATPELAEWRAWLRERFVAGTIDLGGIDDSPGATSVLARELLPARLTGPIAPAARDACHAALRRHLHWTYDADTPFDTGERARLHACAEAARDAATGRDRPAADAFLRYAARTAGRPDAPTRDASMHAAFASQHSPARRTIVWTSTVHAARMAGGRAYRPLGAMLADALGGRVLAVAFTALEGASSMAGAPARELPPMPAGSLEADAMRGHARPAVVLQGDALRALDGRPSRLYGATTSHPWSRHFDVVVVVREERAPVPPVRP